MIIYDNEDSYDTVKLDNGYLTFLNGAYDQTENANNLVRFEKGVEGRGIDFLYVQAPFKVCKYDQQLPEYLHDYSNANADQLIGCLNDISTLDLREELHADEMAHYKSFFVTDHHWLPRTGVWAARTILDFLNTRKSLKQ